LGFLCALCTAIDQILLGPRRISLLSIRIEFFLSAPQCPLKFSVGVSFGCGSAALWSKLLTLISIMAITAIMAIMAISLC
jgi:hypothetical protein